MQEAPPPRLSVVIPVRDGGAAFDRCLAGLERSSFRDFETLVVDDGSCDGSASSARRFGAVVLETDGGRGPARARNVGARSARAPILFFLDADCVVRGDTLGLTVEALADPAIDAVFGSYDDEPDQARVVSRFRNLLHHWVHQRSPESVQTFWSGCGAVRSRVFEDLGGFDDERFPRPSIEDIDFGNRLSARGGRIRLLRQIQVKHLKRWTLRSMLVTDIRDRGIPWTHLLREQSTGDHRDLNVDVRGRAAVALAAISAALTPLAAIEPRVLWIVMALLLVIVVLHRDLYAMMRRKGGVTFGLVSIPLHLLHLLSAAVAYILGSLTYAFGASRRRG